MSSSQISSRWRPMNVEAIVQAAQDFDFNVLFPLRRWLRTADTLQKEASPLESLQHRASAVPAQIYLQEGNDQQAYILLLRHAELVLSKIPTHPEAKHPEYRQQLKEARGQVQANLQQLEQLKPKIQQRYRRHQELLRERQARRDDESRRKRAGGVSEATDRFTGLSLHSRQSSGASVDLSPRQSIEAQDNRDFAVQLATRELRRRDESRKVRQAGVSPELERERRTGGLWGNWEEELVNNGDVREGLSDLSQRMIDARRQLDQPSGSDGHVPRRRSAIPRGAYQYPLVPSQTPQPPPGNAFALRHVSLPTDPAPPGPRAAHHHTEKPPQIPPKQALIPEESPAGTPPPVPVKAPPISPPRPVRPASPLSREPLPPNYTFKPAASLENGQPLRTIFLPPDLRSRFLALAYPNTARGLETCGILCGTLISNALFISKLVIPEQESTSDTCETVNESALFDYVDSEDLMVLGWIHTHPTQTCFMSSRDLHTHSGYQVMLPESIAIVCAPTKEPSWGVFRLTDPPGMKTVLNCTQSGIFHPHAEDNIYTEALRPGHVFEAKGLELELVDLRPR